MALEVCKTYNKQFATLDAMQGWQMVLQKLRDMQNFLLNFTDLAVTFFTRLRVSKSRLIRLSVFIHVIDVFSSLDIEFQFKNLQISKKK